MSARWLVAFERLKSSYGEDASTRKQELLVRLAVARLPTARHVLRLHEALCFLQAYPDDERLLVRVERLLSAFAARPDLARHRTALADSGVAGTEIAFSFYAPTARWLAARWGDRLRIDWRRFEKKGDLERLFPLLALYAETPGLDEIDLGVRGWVAKLKGAEETDAAFLVRRFAALPAPAETKDLLYEELEMPLVLSPGRDTPSRARARLPVRDVFFQRAPLDRGRPDLRAELRRPPVSVRPLTPAEADRLIDASRASMVTRGRDLDAFEHASRQDVRLLDCGEGLSFAAIGVVPQRRLLLEAVYGFLTLKNGVPVGYVLSSALFGSCEIAYNVFESFRGGEAGRVYGRVVGVLAQLFEADSFTIFPYQLGGYDNPEALESGAWWFYRKLGFFPRDPAVVRLMNEEESRMRSDPSHRSPIATLKKLATENLYYHAGRPREDVIGLVELPNVGLKVTEAIAARFGSDRERAARTLSKEAATLLGLDSLAGFSPAERLWWNRWAPLVTLIPGVSRWTTHERRALVAVIRAKGGRRESDFVKLFDRHAKLRRAILRLTR